MATAVQPPFTDATHPLPIAALDRLHRMAEAELNPVLIARARLSPDERAGVERRASGLLADLRAGQRSGWVNQFLQEYRLNTSEGVALLSLAEAFLRVPDADTADRLIADKLDADWRAHAGKSNSGLVNTATWGLVVGRALTSEGDGALRRLMSRAGEPFVRQAVGAAMRRMGQIFVLGRTIDEALGQMRRPENRGFTASFDMLGEAARTWPDAERYFTSYLNAIEEVGRSTSGADVRHRHSVSVKLSALNPRYEVARADEAVANLAEQLAHLAGAAAAAGIGLTVDAEEQARLEMSLAIVADVAARPALSGWDGLGMAVQAYGKRARPVIAWADELARATGRRMHLRLVKGAYWDSEIKHAQEMGVRDYPLFTRKPATDVSYLACAKDMLAATHIDPAFATHNALTVATILEWADRPDSFEFQKLHGMGEGLFERLVRDEGYRCRIYAPVGGHRDLLAYLVRRLLENGANSSFIHQLADEGTTDAAILADPVAALEASGAGRHPSIPLPADLWRPAKGEGRANSPGRDLDDARVLARLAKAAADATVVEVTQAAPVDTMVGRAVAAQGAWTARGVDARAAVLDRWADGMEREFEALVGLTSKEAKKTLADSVAEVREAIDFCRYYAAEARRTLQPLELPGPTGETNVLRMEGRGVWGCISPWNFPLAIFTGQVAAALVTGNAVVAKPAPQTPAIAARAVALAHAAGVPRDVLQLLPGAGEAGAALTGDARVVGVAFTGSNRTAKAIARGLLEPVERPIVPFIAETGGVNAMIVDSTALPEQVTADVIASAFGSAGQRCSALRLLLLQEEVAEPMIAMIAGAMDTLRVGDPTLAETDVGPVIDAEAHERLMAYRERVRAQWVKTVDAPTHDTFVPPTLIRLDDMDELRSERFGPLLHVATWKAGRLAETVRRVNAKGYGLTMGVHSRIAGVAEEVEATARVGNLYVNRTTIGAVVGVQPFGGEGLSGTGPKAGGPHYLPRFCAERVTTTDVTSAGGNASLLSMSDVAGT